MLATLLAAGASAQEFSSGEMPSVNAQSFRATALPTHTLWTDEVGLVGQPRAFASALVHYTNDPLVYAYDDGELLRLVSDVLQADLIAGGSFGPVRGAVLIPVYLFQAGAEEDAGGLGDVALDARFVAIDRERAPLGVGFGGRLSLPSATVGNALGNAGELGYELTASVDSDAGPVLLALNLGTEGGPRADLEGLTLNDRFLGRGAAIYRVDDLTGVGLEASLRLPYSASAVEPGAADAQWLATGYRRFEDWQVRGGFGTGLTHGVGSPDVRVLLGVGWNLPGEPPPPPAPVVVDADGDGLDDPSDRCPGEPEDRDGTADDDGCPDLDDDGDGVADLSDDCRSEPEDSDGVKDDDGCPEPQVPVVVRVLGSDGRPLDMARTVVIGAATRSPGATEQYLELLPGSYTLEATAAGYEPLRQGMNVGAASVVLDVTMRPAAASAIVVTRDRIDLKESIQFETGSAVIKPASFGLMDQVAQVLRDYPEIRSLKIDGHTDSRGSDAANLKLSADRAASVRQYLVDAGIDGARLRSEGFGETRPLDPRENQEAWAKNRRVELTVESWVDQGSAP